MKVAPSFLDGVSLALLTTPSVVAILDAHRCEMERGHTMSGVFDRGGSLVGQGPYESERRLYAVPWKNSLDATGTEDALRRLLVEIGQRQPTKRIVVLRGLLSLFIHTDVEGVLASMPDEIRNRTSVIGQQSADDDWIDGWRAMHDALLPVATEEEADDRPLVTGFCVHRNEGDESGNLDEIGRLLRAIGLEEPRWVFGGLNPCPRRVSTGTLQMAFPFGDAPVPAVTGVSRLDVPLPIGFANTVAMLETMGQATGRSADVARLVAQEGQALHDRLKLTVSRGLSARGAMVIADPWRARGLVSCLEELGMDVPMCVFLRRADRLPDWAKEGDWTRREVLCDPTYDTVRQRMEAGANEGLVDVVVGAGMFRDAAEAVGLASVEIGYPSYLQHFLTPTPFMGFQGILHLAQRLDNALTLRQYRSYRPPSK
jgi:nitrogenase molybdenum-iron protein alpha/beta subunit